MDYKKFLYDLEFAKYDNNDMNNNDIINLAEKNMLEELKKELYEDGVKGIKDIDNLYEALNILNKFLPEKKKTDFFRSYIIAHMNTIKVLQNYYITWQILPGEKPEIVYDEYGNIESLVTGEEYDSIEVINLLRETLETFRKFQK